MSERQFISDFEELYRALKSHDKEEVMFPTYDVAFTIRLDKDAGVDVNVYDKKDEVYLEIVLAGRQLTHWHPNYQEAYDDLVGFVANPAEAAEKLKLEAERSRKKSDGCLAFVLFWLVFTFTFLLVFAELEKEAMVNSHELWAWGVCLGAPLLMAVSATVGFVRPFRKLAERKRSSSAGKDA